MGGRYGGLRISLASRDKEHLGSRSIHRRNHVLDRRQQCFAGAVSLAPFCTLDRILLDNPNAKSILESRFGPLQEKDHRAADALSRTRGMKKPVLLIHGTADQTVPITHGKQLAESIGETATFFPVEGGDHHLRNVDRRLVIETILAWLDTQDRNSQ